MKTGQLLRSTFLSGWLLLTLVSLIASGTAVAGTAEGGCTAPYSLGLEIVDVQDGRRAAVWYPTSEEPSKFTYAHGLSGELAKGADPSPCGPFPLVLFSHGLGGCGTQSLFFTQELARQGYVVAAPDHDDATCSVDGNGPLEIELPEASLLEPETWTDETYAGRRDDLNLLLEQLLASEKFGPVIDADRIGTVGHSLGGYTVLGMAGAWPSWKNERIKATLLFSPYVEPFLAHDTVSGAEGPVMYQGAILDLTITPFVEGPNGAFAATPAPRYFMKLRKGTHFAWTNLLCVEDDTIEQCLTTRENARLINTYSFAFLDRYLKDKESSLLLSDGEELEVYERVSLLTTVSAANFTPETGVAPESIATGFSEGLAQATGSAQGLPLPTDINDLSVRISDSSKAVHLVPLFYVSSNQANFVIPGSTAIGEATIQAFLGDRLVAEGSLTVNQTAPAIFSADGRGEGLAAATYTRFGADGSMSGGGLTFDPTDLSPIPVDVGIDGDQVYLSIYGTGMRSLSGPLTARVGGSEVEVAGPVPHSTFVALDQVNLGPLPPALGGLGEVDIELFVGGMAVNVTTVVMK